MLYAQTRIPKDGYIFVQYMRTPFETENQIGGRTRGTERDFRDTNETNVGGGEIQRNYDYNYLKRKKKKQKKDFSEDYLTKKQISKEKWNSGNFVK